MVLCLFQARKNEPFLKLVSHSSEFGHLRAPLCYFCFVEGRVKSRDVLCNRGANSLDVQLDRLKQPLGDMIESTDKLLRRLPTSTQERPTSNPGAAAARCLGLYQAGSPRSALPTQGRSNSHNSSRGRRDLWCRTTTCRQAQRTACECLSSLRTKIAFTVRVSVTYTSA